MNKEKCLTYLSILDNYFDLDLDPQEYGFDSLEEIKQVITKAFNGQMENGLDSIQDARKYIVDLIGDGEEDEIFEYIIRNYDLEDHPETMIDAREEYDQALKALNSLAKCLKMDEFKQMNQFIPPSKYISLKNIVKEKGLPEDMKREILGFMGTTKITGGKERKSKKNTKVKKIQRSKTNKKIKKSKKRTTNTKRFLK